MTSISSRQENILHHIGQAGALTSRMVGNIVGCRPARARKSLLALWHRGLVYKQQINSDRFKNVRIWGKTNFVNPEKNIIFGQLYTRILSHSGWEFSTNANGTVTIKKPDKTPIRFGFWQPPISRPNLDVQVWIVFDDHVNFLPKGSFFLPVGALFDRPSTLISDDKINLKKR